MLNPILVSDHLFCFGAWALVHKAICSASARPQADRTSHIQGFLKGLLKGLLKEFLEGFQKGLQKGIYRGLGPFAIFPFGFPY